MISTITAGKPILIVLREHVNELDNVTITATTFTKPGTFGVVSDLPNFRLSKEQFGFSSREKSGIGIYVPHISGTLLLDSIALHIPGTSLLPQTLIIEVFAPLETPKSQLVNGSFKTGRPLHTKSITQHPGKPGWTTLSLKNYKVVVPKSAGGLLLVVYAQYTHAPLGPIQPTYISWFHGKGKHPFTGAWLHGTQNSLALLIEQWEKAYKNAYPGIGIHYRTQP